MGIANHVQKAGRSHASDVGDVVDEPSSDAMLPEVRLDEQGVQLRTAVRKAGDAAVTFRDEDAARLNLLERQRDRLRELQAARSILLTDPRAAAWSVPLPHTRRSWL
jgi:hypothetical protein